MRVEPVERSGRERWEPEWRYASVGAGCGPQIVIALVWLFAVGLLEDPWVWWVTLALAGAWMACVRLSKRWTCPRCGHKLPSGRVRVCASCGAAR